MNKYNIKLVPKSKYIIKSQIQGKQKTPIKWTNKYIMSKEIKILILLQTTKNATQINRVKKL